MESDTDKSITLRDSEAIHIGRDHAHGSNVTAVLNSSSSTVKINSLSINLGIVKGKDDPQKCSHFSIRGYVAKMRESGGNNHLPSAYSGEELPPIEVPRFRYWLCQSCLQDYGGGSTPQEVALVSQYGKSMMQPCKTSYSSPACRRLPILPFGEGTSGHKPVDERINGDERVLTVIQEDATHQSSPDNLPDIDELAKIVSIDTNMTAYATVVDDSKKAGIANGSFTSLPVQSTESDQQNQDPSAHPRRKARKVRLLTELLCGSTEKQYQRKESTNIPYLSPTPSSPLKKRKMPQAQDWRPIDVTTQGHVGKKVKVVKGDAAVKTSIVERSRDLGAGEGEGGQNTDKYQCKKHGTLKSFKHGKVTSDPVAAWRSIFSDKSRLERPVPVANEAYRSSHDVSEGKQIDTFSEKRSNASKKVMENPMRNHLFGEDIQRKNVVDSRARVGQCETGLGLGLSLNYEPQSRVSWLPPLPNQVPIQDHSMKDGFFFGESSIGHKGVGLDPQANGRSFYNVRDGHTPRTAFLQEQQPFHTQLSHGSFYQHHNLDFSDPHKKRNNGARGYSEIMMAHSHQNHEMPSNGRSDEREIVELMAKIQYERNSGEARNYNGIPSSSNFHKVSSFNQGMPIAHHQYPTYRRPSSSTMPTMENSGPTTMRNSSGFFHQEPIPSFPSFDTFSHPSNSIRVSDNYHYDESRENNRIPHQSAPNYRQIMEAGRPGNVWSNMEMHKKWSNRSKGKKVMNLDLNIMAPNVLEEQNNMVSLDPSYSNEAIPAMQLLSLMDAGKKSSSSPFMDKKKLTPKPFSCYNGITVTPNSFPYPGMQSSAQKPVENSRNFILGHGASPHSLPVTNSFSSFFHNDHTITHGSQFFHKPQEKKQRGVSSGSVSGHKYRPEDSFGFPLPWHASEASLGPRNVTSGTEICTINKNPADFTTPGPENVYMIDVENLKFRGDRVFYRQEGTI